MAQAAQMEQLSLFPDTPFSRTFRGYSASTAARTSGKSSKRSAKLKTPAFDFLDLTADGTTPEWSEETDSAWCGASSTLNFGAYPNAAAESHLWQILEVIVPLKYCLSVKGCDGITRRAKNRNKELPETLNDALDYMHEFWAQAENLPKDTIVIPMGLCEVVYPDKARTLSARGDSSPCIDRGQNIVAFHLQQDPISNADKTPCLGSGGTFGQASIGVAIYENHAQDSRITSLGDVCTTVAAKWGTGGNNTPLAVFESNCLNPDKVKVAAFMGGQGVNARSIAYNEETAPTLRSEAGGKTVPMCVYGICSQASNSMKSGNPHSGIYEADTARTLDSRGGDPTCNQGGMAVVVNANAVHPLDLRNATKNTQAANTCGMGVGENGETSYTLSAAQSHDVVIAINRAAYNQGKNAQYTPGIDENGVHYSVVAKGPGAVCYRYLVRRLTPTECERLQGYDDDYTKYGADGKEISDNARYKALGNSVALPCIDFVMAGIANANRRQGGGGNVAEN
jgi:hypothetical protein